MTDHTFAGVRAIVVRNDSLARNAVGVLYSGLERQQAKAGGLGNSNRWSAIVQLFEDEGRKLIRSSTDDLHRIDVTVDGFAIIESVFREFLEFLESKYFAIADKGRAFAGSRPDLNNVNNPLSAHWWEAKERLKLEIEASRAMFSQPPSPSPNKVSAVTRNKGGKPIAEHWDQMWAAIAIQLWQGELQPKRQSDITRAMKAWLDVEEIPASDTAIVERARRLWQAIEQAAQAK